MEDKTRCCQNCKAPCAGDFKKVVDLQYSGLVIYLHTKKDEQKKAISSKCEDSFILHNTSTKQLKRNEYISELHQYKTKCGQCKTIVQRVRSLLDEIKAIRENEVIGVCEHCKRANLNKTCKRCDFIVTKFIDLHQKKCEERQERFKVWLCRVKHLLQAILDSGSVCQHRVYKDTELERFLRELKAPLSMRQPDIDFFPNFDPEQLTSLKSLSESKDLLEELLAKIKLEDEKRFSSDDSLYPSTSTKTCICKYLKEGYFGVDSSGFGTGKSLRLSKDFSELLSQDVYKKLIQRLVDLSKALPQGLRLDKELIQELIKTLNTAINQGLSTDIIKKLIKELKELSKILTHDLSVDLNGEVIRGLIKDLNELLIQGSSPDLNKDLIQLLIDLTELLTNELTKGLAKDQSKMLFRSVQKDIGQISTKSLHKEVQQSLPTSQSKEIPQSSPKRQSKEITKDLSKRLDKEDTQDSHKEITQGSHKDVLQGPHKEITQVPHKEYTQSPHKDVTQGPHKEITQDPHKEYTQGPHKDVTQAPRKELTHGPHKNVTKGPLKEVTQSTHKDVTQDPHKEVTQALPIGKAQSKEIAQGIPKDVIKSKPLVSPKDLNKTNKEIKQGSATITTKERTQSSSKDANNQLVQKLADLNKALARGDLDKARIQELSSDINKAIGQGSPDLNKKIIQELTNLCKPAAQGISKNANTELIQTLLKDTSKAISQGLSKDQNKKAVQGLLKDLNNAISQGTKDLKQDLSRDLKKGLSKKASKGLLSSGLSSKGLTSGLSSKALRPRSKDASKKRLIDLALQGSQPEDASRIKKGIKSKKQDDSKDKHLSESEGDILKKGINPEKGTSKKKSPRSQTSKESKIKLSMKEKENVSPAAENKKQKSQKEDQSKLKQKPSQRPQRIMSESILLRMLKDNKEAASKYRLHKERELAKQREMEKRKLALANKHAPVKKKIEIPQVLPDDDVTSESIVVCDIGQTRIPKVMVRDNMIVPYDPHYKDAVDMPVEPIIFKTQINFPEPDIFQKTPALENLPRSKSMKRSKMDFRGEYRDGILRYRLSDREFIDKGWTKLPTKKIMRRMNIYRMEPASPQYDWFERHKQERELFYDNGVKLADIDDDGRGHWYYRNGAVALDYYNAEESNIGQRYVVYSSGEEMDHGRLKPRTVLALFDVLGNGVVYDHYGNVRLKYNQSEGLLVDPKLGPPGRWKWHTLNDPPVLQQVFVNTAMKQRDRNLELQISKANEHDATGDNGRPSHPEMLAIELDNFVKEKANKLLQKFKPFQIRMKAVKLNDHFALKILDQANIYLLFRDGATSLKLNLGMLLISDEIIDTDTSDMADVATPYDKLPPKTDSVENIQKILKTVRSGKIRSSSENSNKASI